MEDLSQSVDERTKVPHALTRDVYLAEGTFWVAEAVLHVNYNESWIRVQVHCV